MGSIVDEGDPTSCSTSMRGPMDRSTARMGPFAGPHASVGADSPACYFRS
jgi:hypothetical protein